MEPNGRSKETRRKEGSTKETRRKEGSKEKITFPYYFTFFEQLVMQGWIHFEMDIPLPEKHDIKNLQKCADRDSNPGLGVGNA